MSLTEAHQEPRQAPTKAKQSFGPRIKAALDEMAWQGATWEQAAIKAGLTLQAMRMALRRADVMSYLRAERQVLRTCLSNRATFRMVDLSEQSDNMAAAVSATKTLMGEQDQELSGQQHRAPPGLLIQIVQAPHMTHVVADAAKPLIEQDVVPVDEHERQPGRLRE